MLFSDNVSMEEEKKLKEYAVSKELLMMGPDCGTAVVNGLPLAFANVIHKGPIGICGASGTALRSSPSSSISSVPASPRLWAPVAVT